MTRNEWVENIRDFSDLRSFCFDTGYWEDEANELYDDWELDSQVNEDISQCNYNWQSLRESLNQIPQGYNWYRRNGYLDYDGLDDSDFDDWKYDLLRYLDDSYYFDEEEEEDERHGDAPEFTRSVEYRSQEKPRWMCFASQGDESIPAFATNSVGLDALLGMDALNVTVNAAESQRSA